MKQNKMKNFLNKLVATVLTISLSCSYGIVSNKEIKADNRLIPTAYDNLNISLRKKSQMVNLANGYMRVFYNEENIGIEYYDKNFNIQSRKNIKLHAFMEEEKSFSMISISMRFLKELSRKFIKMEA